MYIAKVEHPFQIIENLLGLMKSSLPWACQEHGTVLQAVWLGQSDGCRQTTWS
jgi:hypothetical protein